MWFGYGDRNCLLWPFFPTLFTHLESKDLFDSDFFTSEDEDKDNEEEGDLWAFEIEDAGDDARPVVVWSEFPTSCLLSNDLYSRMSC